MTKKIRGKTKRYSINPKLYKMKKDKQDKESKQETWRLIYPDKTESVMNYNPVAEERKWTIKEVLKLIKVWNGYGDDRFSEGEVKELVREVKKLK